MVLVGAFGRRLCCLRRCYRDLTTRFGLGFGPCERPHCVAEFDHGFRQNCVNDFALIEEQTIKERLVELAPPNVWCAFVQLPWLVKETDVRHENLDANLQLTSRLLQAPFGLLAVDLNPPQPRADLLARQLVVGCQIEQTLLLHIELFQLCPVTIMQRAQGLLLIGKDTVQEVRHLRGKLWREPEAEVIPRDRILHEDDRQMRKITHFVLPTATHEVGMHGATAALGFGVDHAARSTGFLAAIAEQQTLEVVEMHPIALPSGRTLLKHLLHPVEELLTDDRFVPTGIDLPLVDDDSRVVGVAEHPVKLAGGNRLSGIAPTRPRR